MLTAVVIAVTYLMSAQSDAQGRILDVVHVPSGPFLMGDDSLPDTRPARFVAVHEFWIARNLVTVAEFRKFCTDQHYPYDWNSKKPAWGYIDDYPMVNVTWNDANAFCEWCGGDLPTEAQWEKAARGTDGRMFPWGNKFDDKKACSSVMTKRTSPEPVGSRPSGASLFGCLDMSGNAAQWCRDWYSDDCSRLPLQDPEGPASGTEKVLKGGNWFFTKTIFFSCAFRGDQPPTFSYKGIGFRVCFEHLKEGRPSSNHGKHTGSNPVPPTHSEFRARNSEF